MAFLDSVDSDIAGFFDDSGTHPESPGTVCAGYVATVQQWREMERNWRELDQTEKFIPFHTTDCLAGREQFKGWTEERKDRVMRSLIGYINLRVRRAFIVGVAKDDYDEIVPRWLKERAGSNHYTFCVWSCFGFIRGWRKDKEVSQSVHYVFDSMGKGKGEIIAAFDSLLKFGNKDDIGAYEGGLAFESKKQFIQLQAADMLAAGAGWHLNHRILTNSSQPPSPWFNDLMNLSPSPLNGFHSRESLKRFVESMEKHRDNPKWGIAGR